MTGCASNLNLKFVLHHDDLKNVNHVVLWRPFRGLLRDSNPIPLDRAQKVGPESCVTQPCICALSPEIPEIPPTYIRQKKANQDRVKIFLLLK